MVENVKSWSKYFFDTFFGHLIYEMWGKKIMSLGPLVKELVQCRLISAYSRYNSFDFFLYGNVNIDFVCTSVFLHIVNIYVSFIACSRPYKKSFIKNYDVLNG